TNPDPKEKTPFKVFPSDFEVKSRGVPQRLLPDADSAVESIEDLAAVLGGAVEFLRTTARDAPLGIYFTDKIALDDLNNPSSPGIFPRDGRMLAVGLIGAVALNFSTPAIGHFEQ